MELVESDQFYLISNRYQKYTHIKEDLKLLDCMYYYSQYGNKLYGYFEFC